MMRYEKYVKLVPVLMYMVNLTTLIMYEIDLDKGFIREFSKYFNSLTGHSLLVCLFGFFYAMRHKHCIFLQTLWIGCGLLNLLNLTKKIFDFDYYTNYAIIILGVAFFMGLFWQIKTHKKDVLHRL